MKACYLPDLLYPSRFQHTTIEDLLQDIKDEKYKQIIDALPDSILDEPAYKVAKKTLPSMVLNGDFNNSINNDGFSESNGLFHFDIDKLDDAKDIKYRIIEQIPELYAIWLSPSRRGLKGLVRIPDDLIHNDKDFKIAFKQIEALFMTFGHVLDKNCKDVRRLCFVSSDRDIYINKEAPCLFLNMEVEEVKQSAPVFIQDSSNLIKRCCNIILNSTSGDHHPARLRAGRLAGGYIATGAINEFEVLCALENASDYISSQHKDSQATIKTEHQAIKDGIEDGKQSPLSYNEYQKIIIPEPKKEETKKTKEIKPYQGVMEKIVNETLRIANKPQPELSILSALIGMASCIGGEYKMPSGMRFNLYGIGISGTGTGKDKVMLPAVKLSKLAGAEIGGQPGSGAALEDMLEPQGTKILLNIDEVAHFIADMNDGSQSHMASLAKNLLTLFSASSRTHTTRRLANSSNNEQKECENPCVSMLGFACPEKLGASLGKSSNVEDGLLGRILFVNGLSNVRPQRNNGEFSLPFEVNDKAVAISKCRGIVLGIDSDADQRLDELLLEFDSASVTSTNPFARALKTRSYEKCERIAGVLAIWDNPEAPTISLSNVKWAEMFINHSDHAVITFTSEHMHNGQVQLDASEIKKAMHKILSGEIKTRTVKQAEVIKTGCIPSALALKVSRLCKKDFDVALEHLIALEEVNRVNELKIIHFI
jgi:hypothetical protein